MALVVVQSLIQVWLFATPRTTERQASLSFTIFWSLLKLMAFESLMPSNHLFLCHPFSSCLQSFQHWGLFQWVGSSHQVAKILNFSLSISPRNEYSESISFKIDWFDLLAVQGTLRVFLNTTVQKHHSLALSNLYSPNLTFICDYWKYHSFDYGSGDRH